MGAEPNSAVEIQSLFEVTELINGKLYSDVIVS